MNRITQLTLMAAVAMTASLAQAAPGDALVAKIKSVRPDLPIETVHESGLDGVLALELDDGSVLYGTADGRFVFAGDMYALASDGFVNLTDSMIRDDRRRALLAGVQNEDMIVFEAVGEPKTHISIFTDVDCGYCRQLHQEMAEINALGIEVRYLAYPRAGIDSESYRRIVSAWCADDRQGAITRLKLGDSIPERSCPNPVAVHYDLGRKVGVRGTPAIVTAGGRMLPGYMPPDKLAAALGL